jgi:hypothetical protein
MSGEVVQVDGDKLAVKMHPGGEIRLFNVQPGRQFIIDGQTKLIGDLKPGTTLKATIATKTQSVTVRTMTVTNGTVWYREGNYVIITLENGENREYKVPADFKFTSNGRSVGVGELRKGMKVSATKIVAEPVTEISTHTTITGSAPR